MSSQQQFQAAGSALPRTGSARWLQVRIAALSQCDLAAVALIAGLAILAAATVHHYSVSNDEEVQQRYGELILAYYRTGFVDQALFHYQNLYLYGGLFDIAAALLQQIVAIKPYLLRHILCAGFGLGGLVATWGTARSIGGPRAGLIAVALLAVTGPWFGSMFNHTKDIPFAAVMMGACYCLVMLARGLPRPRPGYVLGFGLLLGCALGLRSLALLLVGYAAVAVLLRLPRPWLSQETARFALRSALALAPALLLGYVLMLVLWPWSALAPLNPIRGLLTFGEFNYDIDTILAGQVYSMAHVPRWYVPTYLAIKLPIALLAGAVLALAWLLWPRGTRSAPNGVSRGELFLVAVFALYPLLCEVATQGPAFTGLRHFLFLVPPLAVLAGIGWDRSFAWMAQWSRALHWAIATAVACSLAWTTATLVRLHPYEYMYYNAFVGGLPGAKYRYVMDYWANSMREAVRDLQAHLNRTDPNWRLHGYDVSICSEDMGFKTVANPALRLTDEWDKADFFISTTHMRCDKELPGTVVATVERLGVPIAVVKDHRHLKTPQQTPAQ